MPMQPDPPFWEACCCRRAAADFGGPSLRLFFFLAFAVFFAGATCADSSTSLSRLRFSLALHYLTDV